MRLSELRLEWERVYWRDLLARLPNVKAAARVAGIAERWAWTRLRACDVEPGAIGGGGGVICQYEIGLTLDAFLRGRERRFWIQLIALHRSTLGAARAAGIHRATIYRRFVACDISQRFIRMMLKGKAEYGNEAWRALDDERPGVGRP